MRAFIILILWCAPLLAQPARAVHRPWWDSPIARDLELTEDQQKQIRSIVSQHRSKLIDLRAAVEKSEGEMADLFNEENVDMKKAESVIGRVANNRAELMKATSMMSLALRRVLTPKQWQELQRRQPQGAGMPGMPGMQMGPRQEMPGMPGGRMRNQPRPDRGNPQQPTNPIQD